MQNFQTGLKHEESWGMCGGVRDDGDDDDDDDDDADADVDDDDDDDDDVFTGVYIHINNRNMGGVVSSTSKTQ